MIIKIRAFSELKKKFGHQFEVELENGSNVGDLLRHLGGELGSPDKFVGEDGELAENLSVFINGLSVNVGEGSGETLSDGDTVSLLPPAGGG
jgi:MoaD family protein